MKVIEGNVFTSSKLKIFGGCVQKRVRHFYAVEVMQKIIVKIKCNKQTLRKST